MRTFLFLEVELLKLKYNINMFFHPQSVQTRPYFSHGRMILSWRDITEWAPLEYMIVWLGELWKPPSYQDVKILTFLTSVFL